MSQWPFVIAAYAVTVIAVGALLAWSFSAMRRAEQSLEAAARE